MKEENVKLAFANARQIFGLLSLIDENKENSEITLNEILQQFQEQYHLPLSEHYFCNQHTLILLLVTHLVLPKESYFKNLPEIPLKSLNEKWSIPLKNNETTLKEFIRRLRNSVCHGNFEVSENLKIKFSDVNSRDALDIFEAEFSSNQLFKFMQAFAYYILTDDINLENLKR